MKNTPHTKAYILLSGGQDSFVSLIWSMKQFDSVEAVTVDYGQSHSIEIEYAGKIAEKFDIPHTIYPVGDFLKSISDSSLLTATDHNKKHTVEESLPASFVPNRNGLFLTILSNHAFRKGEKHIRLVIGACETDYSGYPDCRDNYIKAKQLELSLGLDRPVSIYTPLMWKTKAETFKMAEDAGYLDELITLTMTCYNGNETLHEWGRGCDDCPSCKLRKNGYLEFKRDE
jgi:7-cyano-7-deazaguanine synthase